MTKVLRVKILKPVAAAGGGSYSVGQTFTTWCRVALLLLSPSEHCPNAHECYPVAARIHAIPAKLLVQLQTRS